MTLYLSSKNKSYKFKNQFNNIKYRKINNISPFKSHIRFMHSSSIIYKSKSLDKNSILGSEILLVSSKETGILSKKEELPKINIESNISLPISLSENKKDKDIAFNEWLAGVIDGDGHFYLFNKIQYLCITMGTRDLDTLKEIQNKFGGKIYQVSKANAFKYMLMRKKDLIHLINSVNGEIRNPTRIEQMNKLCIKFNIKLNEPKPLTYNNGWFSGFLDSDGCISLNIRLNQVYIIASQKYNHMLLPLIKLYGGVIIDNIKSSSTFNYRINRKEDVIKLIDNYLTHYPLRTIKLNRLNLIKDYYNLKTYNNNPNDISKYNTWIEFKDRWDYFKK